MTDKEPQTPTAIRLFLVEGARELTRAANNMGKGPSPVDLPVDDYAVLARICAGLSMMLSTHAEYLQGKNLILPKWTIINDRNPDQR